MQPIDRHTALLVVDMQNGFHDPRWGARNNPQAEASVARLLAAWRDASVPVIHVHHQSASATGLFRAGTPGIEPMASAMPAQDEAVYRKRVNCAFIGTGLEADLRRQRIDRLVVVGLTTNHCVSTTARIAGNLGFTTYVVADATAAFDRAGGDGRHRSARDVHNAALGDLHGEFAEVVDARTVFAALPRRPIGPPRQADRSANR